MNWVTRDFSEIIDAYNRSNLSNRLKSCWDDRLRNYKRTNLEDKSVFSNDIFKTLKKVFPPENLREESSSTPFRCIWWYSYVHMNFSYITSLELSGLDSIEATQLLRVKIYFLWSSNHRFTIIQWQRWTKIKLKITIQPITWHLL